jgi:hypothetical protein
MVVPLVYDSISGRHLYLSGVSRYPEMLLP